MGIQKLDAFTLVSERWLQYYINKKLGAVKREVEVKSKKKGKLTIQGDEMWSFVGNKDNKQWIWLAINASIKEIVGVYIAILNQLQIIINYNNQGV